MPTHRDSTKWQSDRDLERRNQYTRAIAAKLNIQKPAPIISVAGFLFSQLNTTISRNPYFGANKQFLEQKGKTKPAGAKLYQHQQAVSYLAAEDDTKWAAGRWWRGWALSLDSKPKRRPDHCSTKTRVSGMRQLLLSNKFSATESGATFTRHSPVA